MGLRAWLRRRTTDKDETARHKSAKRKAEAARRRTKTRQQRPRPPREEQYDSEFITRYGDPFD
jgi:hypothetical protein